MSKMMVRIGALGYLSVILITLLALVIKLLGNDTPVIMFSLVGAGILLGGFMGLPFVVYMLIQMVKNKQWVWFAASFFVPWPIPLHYYWKNRSVIQ